MGIEIALPRKKCEICGTPNCDGARTPALCDVHESEYRISTEAAEASQARTRFVERKRRGR